MLVFLLFPGEYLLEDIRNYTYLTHGAVTMPSADDKELYKELLEAMAVMNISKDEQQCKLNLN